MSNHEPPEILVPSEIISPGEPRFVYVSRPRHKYWLHLLLLLATFFSTMVVGARLQWNFENGLPPFFMGDGYFPFSFSWALHGRHLLMGMPFSLTLMTILLAHEMGHYLYCVKYRVAATLPFFIPFPTLIGTFGAFIRIRSQLHSRRILFDIGIAGPIAGFVVATAALFFSLGRCQPAPFGAPSAEIGYPLIFVLVQKLLVLSGHAGRIAATSLSRVYFHPVVIAAWAGMLATSLNLLPSGQLDGGHIVFAVSPRAHKAVSRATILVLIPMGIFFWTGWLIWAVLLRFVAMRHPAVPEWPGIGTGRRLLAALALIIFVVTIMPLPIQQVPLIDFFRHTSR